MVNEGGISEGDFVDVYVRGNGSVGNFVEVVDEVENISREVSFFNELSYDESG